MNKPYELEAFLEETGGEREPFYLHISSAKKTPGENDFYCVIHAPKLFKLDMKIFGVDEQQAQDLSIRFVRLNINYAKKRLVDSSGNEIKLS